MRDVASLIGRAVSAFGYDADYLRGRQMCFVIREDDGGLYVEPHHARRRPRGDWLYKAVLRDVPAHMTAHELGLYLEEHPETLRITRRRQVCKT